MVEEPEDELTRVALEDPAADEAHGPVDSGPTLWRVVALLTFAVAIVYSQMYSPLSMYSGLVGLSEPEVGLLFAINGLMVVVAQYFVTLVTERGTALKHPAGCIRPE